MQTAKRRWIHSGLALAPGVGLVRRAEGLVGRSTRDEDALASLRVVLVGDELAEGLQTALRVLSEDAGARMSGQPRRGSTVAAWIEEGWLAEAIAVRPTWVVAAFTWGIVSVDRFAVPTGAMRVAQGIVSDAGAKVVWVAPPGALPDAVREVRENVALAPHGVIGSQGLEIQVGPDGARPTALGYAGWAGAVWTQFETGASHA